MSGSSPSPSPALAAPGAVIEQAPARSRYPRLDPERLRRAAAARSPRGRRDWPFRLLDCVLCLVAAMPATLIIAAVAVAMRRDSPGPVFFSQLRTGRDGRRFRFWKLRTMVADADRLKPRLRPLSEVPWPDFKLSHDPRVTRVGAWLRRTSLDELPQLWNIWRGDMSFVGPRPTSFAASTYQCWHTERLEVRPGLSGLWQVLGRGRCSFDERVRMDVAYVRARSLRLNFAILAATVLSVLRGEGAK